MRLRWSDSARADLLEQVEFISRDRPVPARQVAARIRKALRTTQRQPRIGRVVPEIGDPEIRERIVPPYRVLYHVGTEILVLAVIHGRRNLRRAVGLPPHDEADGDE